jgi:gluconolactonase
MPPISRRSLLAAAAAAPFAAYAAPVPGSYGSVRSVRAALEPIVATDALVEQLAWGIRWAEGPVWVKNGGYLLFSDPPANTLYRWTPGGKAEIFMQPSGLEKPDPALREPGSNGLAIDASGALVMADSGNRALARVDLATKQKKILVDRFEGKRFNSPNDLCIAKSGAIYFTDPPFGLDGQDASPVKETPFSGVYRYAPDGTVAVLDKELTRPNGIALSPDEGTLYVSNCDKAKPIIKAYEMGPDGMPVNSAVFFDTTPLITPERKSSPDGMKIDIDGNLFVAGPGGILVLSKEGKLLGVINTTGRGSSNCAFGEDGSTLFVTSGDIVVKLRLKTKGQGWD